MQTTVWKFGLISGAIVSVLLIAGTLLMVGPDGKINFDYGTTFGYVSMVISLSLVFFGIKTYRDKELGGSISFGKAFAVGILITLVASTMYVITWMIYYHTSSNTDIFGEQVVNHQMETMRAAGKTETEISSKITEYQDFMKIYDSNPIVMFGVTLMEIFPVGLVVTLLSSFILKTKNNIA